MRTHTTRTYNTVLTHTQQAHARTLSLHMGKHTHARTHRLHFLQAHGTGGVAYRDVGNIRPTQASRASCADRRGARPPPLPTTGRHLGAQCPAHASVLLTTRRPPQGPGWPLRPATTRGTRAPWGSTGGVAQALLWPRLAPVTCGVGWNHGAGTRGTPRAPQRGISCLQSACPTR